MYDVITYCMRRVLTGHAEKIFIPPAYPLTRARGSQVFSGFHIFPAHVESQVLSSSRFFPAR